MAAKVIFLDTHRILSAEYLMSKRYNIIAMKESLVEDPSKIFGGNPWPLIPN